VIDAALPWLSEDYQLVLIHIDQVDYAGHHEGGVRSSNWDAAASRADALLAEIVDPEKPFMPTIDLKNNCGRCAYGYICTNHD
jgi:hypothetical protein